MPRQNGFGRRQNGSQSLQTGSDLHERPWKREEGKGRYNAALPAVKVGPCTVLSKYQAVSRRTRKAQVRRGRVSERELGSSGVLDVFRIWALGFAASRPPKPGPPKTSAKSPMGSRSRP